MISARQVRALKRLIPDPARRWARPLLVKSGLWKQAARLQRGIIEDLYYWVADGRLDTLLPLQNYFSVFFPDLATETSGTLSLYDRRGRWLGRKPLRLGAHALLKIRVSQVLRELGVGVAEGYGTLLCDFRIPEPVLSALQPYDSFYFWDRFYLAYLSAENQPCFVHGLDKTYIADADGKAMEPFYPPGKRYPWVPELPVNLTLYERFSVIMANRTRRAARVSLTVSDGRDASRQWSETIRPFGVHRFELDAHAAQGLQQEELRLRVDGMPSRWGRPIVFKEFRNGAISAQHC